MRGPSRLLARAGNVAQRHLRTRLAHPLEEDLSLILLEAASTPQTSAATSTVTCAIKTRALVSDIFIRHITRGSRPCSYSAQYIVHRVAPNSSAQGFIHPRNPSFCFESRTSSCHRVIITRIFSLPCRLRNPKPNASHGRGNRSPPL